LIRCAPVREPGPQPQQVFQQQQIRLQRPQQQPHPVQQQQMHVNPGQSVLNNVRPPMGHPGMRPGTIQMIRGGQRLMLQQRSPHPGQQQQQIQHLQQHQQVKVMNQVTGKIENKPRASLIPCPPPQHLPQQQQGAYHQTLQVQARPPMPPQQQQQPPNEIAYNVEHVFTENGKVVRKMPIKMGEETIWVDCMDINEDNKNGNSAAAGGLLLDLDMSLSSDTPNQSRSTSGTPGPSTIVAKNAKDFSADERTKIVSECVDELISPAELALRYNVNVTAIRSWVKASGKTLPSRYKVTSQKPSTPKPATANNLVK
jgi:hypothetical protein